MSVLRRHQLFSSDSEGDDRPRHEKVVRQRINFNVANSFQFKEKFRLRYEEVEFVLSKIGHRLKHKTSKNQALTPEQRLLSALHWLGSELRRMLSSHNTFPTLASESIVIYFFQFKAFSPEMSSEQTSGAPVFRNYLTGGS